MDIQVLLQDLVLSLNRNFKRSSLKNLTTEEMMLRYFESPKIVEQLNKSGGTQFPVDAIKACKDIAYSLHRIFEEYTSIYNANFREIRTIVTDTRSIFPLVNQVQLNQTLREIETLFEESRTLDADNIRLKSVFERLESVCQQ